MIIDYKAIAGLKALREAQELINWLRVQRDDARFDLENPTAMDSITKVNFVQGQISAFSRILDLIENKASDYADYIDAENSPDEEGEPVEEKGIIE